MQRLAKTIALAGIAAAACALEVSGAQRSADAAQTQDAPTRPATPVPAPVPAPVAEAPQRAETPAPAARRIAEQRRGAGAQTPAGQTGGVEHDLARARKIFADTDLDSNSAIDRAEAVRAGVSVREFQAFDEDGSGAVTHDEFISGYRRLVSAAGQRVAPDLEAENTRIEALRQAKAAQSARIANARQDAATGAPAGPSARRIYNARSDQAEPAPAGPAAARRVAPDVRADSPQRGSSPLPRGATSRGAVPATRDAARPSTADGVRPGAVPSTRGSAVPSTRGSAVPTTRSGSAGPTERGSAGGGRPLPTGDPVLRPAVRPGQRPDVSPTRRPGASTRPAAQRPAAQRPAAQRPAAQRPAAQRPGAQRPAAQRPQPRPPQPRPRPAAGGNRGARGSRGPN